MSDAGLERQTMSRVSRRLLPFLLVLDVFRYLDRSNVSIAALQMNDELRFSSAVFGLGAGIFFFGYALFESPPSNLALARVGARLWIARIMVSWGILAAAMAFVKHPPSFTLSDSCSVWPRRDSFRASFTTWLTGFRAATTRGLSGGSPSRFPLRRRWRPSRVRPDCDSAASADSQAGNGCSSRKAFPRFCSASRYFGTSRIAPRRRPGSGRPSGPGCLPGSRRIGPRRFLPTRHIDCGPCVTGTFGCWPFRISPTSPSAFGYTAWAPQLIKSLLGTRDSVTALVTGGIALISTAAYLIGGILSDRANDRCAYAMWGVGICTLGCLGTALAPTPASGICRAHTDTHRWRIFNALVPASAQAAVRRRPAAAPIAVISSIGSRADLGPTLIGYAKQMTANGLGSIRSAGAHGLTGFAVCWMLRQHVSFRRQPIEAGAAVAR